MAELIGMFQPYDNKYGYRKAIVRTEDKVYFESLGFAAEIVHWKDVVSEPEAIVPVVNYPKAVDVIEPTKAALAEVSTRDIALAKINSLQNKAQVSRYLKTVTAHELTGEENASLAKTKETACKLIEAHFND